MALIFHLDAYGRTIDAKSKVAANGTMTIGHRYRTGTYYAEVIQGRERVVVKLP